MFDSPGLRTAIAATEKGTPQALPSSAFVPENSYTRTSPRADRTSLGQFEASTTSFAVFPLRAVVALHSVPSRVCVEVCGPLGGRPVLVWPAPGPGPFGPGARS